jgi:hypothetical protein
MKKLLFILMVTLTLMSCNQPSLVKTDLPIEVVSLKEAKKFDTILTINTDMRVFTFSKQEEYQGSYSKSDEKGAMFIIIIVLIMIILFVALVTV